MEAILIRSKGGTTINDAVVQTFLVGNESDSIKQGNFVKFILEDNMVKIIKSIGNDSDSGDGVINGVAKTSGNSGDNVSVYTLNGTVESAMEILMGNVYVKAVVRGYWTLQEATDYGYIYTINEENNTATITGYTGTKTELEVPIKIDSYTVIIDNEIV